MTLDPQQPDLSEVFHAETEFEAHTRAATLREEGIDAVVIAAAPSWTGQLAISGSAQGAGVWVRQEDSDHATSVLQRASEDSVDLDWDQVDVGEREDALPLSPTRGMPLPARIAFATVLVAVLLGAFAALLSILRW